jgi:FtsP/CotA-like multicopper oxidase with cupredoxin domain
VGSALQHKLKATVMMDRRNLLALMTTGLTGLAVAPVLRFPASTSAAESSPPARTLKAVKRTLDIKGKAASVYGLVRDDGGHGLILEPGQSFNVALTNQLSEQTLIHWHGLTPPWPMDGVPDVPAPLMKPGETRTYAFPIADPGTYWMHAHTLQEQNLLAAPLIVRSASDVGKDEQEVVVLLHDFSFSPAEELLARLTKGRGKSGMSMSGMGMGGMAEMMSGMGHDELMKHMTQMRGTMPGMKPMGTMGGMDLNDIDYDAYLANDRTLDDPEVIPVEANGHVRLRIINGAAATNFTIDTGFLHGELIAVDGQDVAPVGGAMFPIAMGQRLDIRLAIPKEGGAFPVLALREGAVERTGIVLASPNAKVAKLADKGASKGPVATLGLETLLRASQALLTKPADRGRDVLLTGDMASYSWGMQNGDIHSIKTGERIEITMHNLSMMTHPMHLHGHHFQVIWINGRPVQGAVRDTVTVPPMASVTIAFDAANPGIWAFHCHHLYHMASGMMAFVAYEGAI